MRMREYEGRLRRKEVKKRKREKKELFVSVIHAEGRGRIRVLVDSSMISEFNGTCLSCGSYTM